MSQKSFNTVSSAALRKELKSQNWILKTLLQIVPGLWTLPVSIAMAQLLQTLTGKSNLHGGLQSPNFYKDHHWDAVLKFTISIHFISCSCLMSSSLSSSSLSLFLVFQPQVDYPKGPSRNKVRRYAGKARAHSCLFQIWGKSHSHSKVDTF